MIKIKKPKTEKPKQPKPKLKDPITVSIATGEQIADMDRLLDQPERSIFWS